MQMNRMAASLDFLLPLAEAGNSRTAANSTACALYISFRSVAVSLPAAVPPNHDPGTSISTDISTISLPSYWKIRSTPMVARVVAWCGVLFAGGMTFRVLAALVTGNFAENFQRVYVLCFVIICFVIMRKGSAFHSHSQYT